MFKYILQSLKNTSSPFYPTAVFTRLQTLWIAVHWCLVQIYQYISVMKVCVLIMMFVCVDSRKVCAVLCMLQIQCRFYETFYDKLQQANFFSYHGSTGSSEPVLGLAPDFHSVLVLKHTFISFGQIFLDSFLVISVIRNFCVQFSFFKFLLAFPSLID